MKKYIALSIGIIILYFSSIYVYTPNLSIYAQSLGATVIMLGMMGGAYGLLQTLFRIPAGIYSDRIQKKKIFIVVGMGVNLISAVMMMAAKTPALLALGRLMAGASLVSWVIFIALFISYFPPEKASRASGILMASNSGGQMLGTGVGGTLYHSIGPLAPFWFAVIAGGLAFILVLMIKETKREKRPVNPMSMIKLCTRKDMIIYSIVGFMISYAMLAGTFTFTPVIAAKIGADASDLGFMALAFTAMAALGSLMVGTAIKRKYEKTTAVAALFLMAVSCALTPLIGSFLSLCLLQVVFGLGKGLAFSVIVALASKSVPSDMQATAAGYLNSFASIGILLGPVITGYLIENLSYTAAYVLTALGLAAAGILLIMLKNGEEYSRG